MTAAKAHGAFCMFVLLLSLTTISLSDGAPMTTSAAASTADHNNKTDAAMMTVHVQHHIQQQMLHPTEPKQDALSNHEQDGEQTKSVSMLYDMFSHATSAARKAAQDAVSVVADKLAPARPIARRELMSRNQQRTKQQERKRSKMQERKRMKKQERKRLKKQERKRINRQQRRNERSDRDAAEPSNGRTVTIVSPGQSIGDAVAAHINSGYDLAASYVNAKADVHTALLKTVHAPIEVTITKGGGTDEEDEEEDYEGTGDDVSDYEETTTSRVGRTAGRRLQGLFLWPHLLGSVRVTVEDGGDDEEEEEDYEEEPAGGEEDYEEEPMEEDPCADEEPAEETEPYGKETMPAKGTRTMPSKETMPSKGTKLMEAAPMEAAPMGCEKKRKAEARARPRKSGRRPRRAATDNRG